MKVKIISILSILMLIFNTNFALAENNIRFSDISIENENAVTLDLDLIKEFSGAGVTWETSNESVITLSGEVIRPGINEAPVEVYLTATVNGKPTQFVVTVLPFENESEILALSSSKLTFNSLSGEQLNAVSNELVLPAKDKYGTIIQWKSSDTGVLKIVPDGSNFKGEIMQPGFSDGDAFVMLTATMLNGNSFMEKQFYIRVKEYSRIHTYSTNISGYVDQFNDLFTMNNKVNAIREDLYLPQIQGIDISYSSGDRTLVDESGKVTRPVGEDKKVTFIATLKNGYENTHITYSLTIKAMDEDETIDRLARDLEWVVEQISSANLAAVTENMTFPTKAPNGSNIAYVSSNTAVLATNGAVTRPSTDTDVMLNIKVYFAEESRNETITIRVKGITQQGGAIVPAGSGTSPAGPSAGGPVTPVPQVTPVQPKYTYSDVTPSHWAYTAIEDLTKRGIVDGNDNGTFGPNDHITREAFIKMLVTAMDMQLDRYETPFKDTADNAWYYNYVSTAVNAGLVNGIEDDFFGVGYNTTRQDICVLIHRAFYAGQDAENANCNDFSEVSDYAKTAVSVMYELGILNGDDNGNFNPKTSASRAEVAAIFSRLLNNQ